MKKWNHIKIIINNYWYLIASSDCTVDMMSIIKEYPRKQNVKKKKGMWTCNLQKLTFFIILPTTINKNDIKVTTSLFIYKKYKTKF